ncbi:acid protease [Aspergillus indologenus CBS 114.80]|uniref:Acid protease n=1 Tax=Aspergillus indologenus CBS 114.80 TaxID=1450541 RepID=A0A2V5IAF0_9EURO|nr:acid protease [Aspergillus indologenus CBS 114.80]
MTPPQHWLILTALGSLPLCLATPWPSAPRHISSHIPLVRRTDPAARLFRRDKYGIETVSESDGFWFGSFDVGSSKSLHLLIDTGSSDVIINPGYYNASSASVNLNLTFENGYGTTQSDGSGTGSVAGTLYNDTITYGSLTIDQTIGSANGTALIPADGIVGFAGVEVAQFPNGAPPFFHALCQQRQVSSCRFGVVLGSNSTGTQVLGELDTSLFEGNLTTTSIVQEWAFFADVAVNDTILTKDVPIELDTGTATITGPVEEVLAIFEATNIQAVVQNTSDGVTVTGYFPCDSPPTVGFSIPSQANATAAVAADSDLVSHQSAIFNIAADQWIAANNGNNNCTAVLAGATVASYPTLWVVGQPFFRGLYIDHNVENATVGLAVSKTQSGTQTSASVTPSSASSVVPSSGAVLGQSVNVAMLPLSVLLAWVMH